VRDPTASDDPVLMGFASDSSPNVVCTDSVLAALMCCPKSVFSWDIVITKKGNHLVFDKRPGGPLDLLTVNENAAEPPVEAEKDQNINSHDALSFEATAINKNFNEQVVSDENIDFVNSNPFVPEHVTNLESIQSRAYRYRKWNLDGINLYLRTTIHCVDTGNNVLKMDLTNPVPDTVFSNTFALNEFDYKAAGSGGALSWRKKLDNQRGSVFVCEMKNNSHKLAKWAVQSILSGVDMVHIGFCSRQSTKDRKRHTILGVNSLKPNDFIDQINFDYGNAWGIAKTVIDICMELGDGKYVLLKDPEKPVLILYSVGE
jgi:translation initiation factor 3 subunit D